ncbi:MAG: hypothetical protein WDM92_00290 [Caulobacteraceae bacterium]
MERALDPHLAWNDLVLGSTPLGTAINVAFKRRFGPEQAQLGRRRARDLRPRDPRQPLRLRPGAPPGPTGCARSTTSSGR